ncbi:MAG: hypothetical protein JWN04_5306 [Myxococcaceae bacterium]|nr:hypothetical protein [Myxococcaceae bacterium]
MSEQSALAALEAGTGRAALLRSIVSVLLVPINLAAAAL